MSHGLRDLWDLDRLVRELSDTEQNFWSRLLDRAGQLHVQRSLYYALRYMRHHFDSPVPAEAMSEAKKFGPVWPVGSLMDAVFERGFVPVHPENKFAGAGAARFFLYVRSHYLRMPLYLLLPHLIRKAWMEQVQPAFSADQEEGVH